MVLDPILIFALNMGTAGAALATALSALCQRLQEAGETDAFEKLMAERRKRDSRLREQQRNAIHETLEHTG